MNFRPELASAVRGGGKTVTRRLVSDNPRSPWWRERCGLRVDHSYAVCPGRGKDSIGRVVVTDVRREQLGRLDVDEAKREGFFTVEAFEEAFTGINGKYDPAALVWRVEFRALLADDEPLWEAAA
jgi:hypothetical protein